MNRAECQIEPPVVQCPSAEGAVGRMEVEVVYAPPGREVDLTRLQLPGESTVAQAIEASGVRARHRLAADALDVGIWGRRVPLHTRLRARDRVEIYRPLQCDPKEARRLRYRRQAKGFRPENPSG